MKQPRAFAGLISVIIIAAVLTATVLNESADAFAVRTTQLQTLNADRAQMLARSCAYEAHLLSAEGHNVSVPMIIQLDGRTSCVLNSFSTTSLQNVGL